MLEFKHGMVTTSKTSNLEESEDQIYYYNISNSESGQARVFSEVFKDGKTPERIFVSNLEIRKGIARYVAKLSYSVYKLSNSKEKKFYNMKHGVYEFNIDFNKRYEFPIEGLEEQKFSVFIKEKESGGVKFESLFSEYLNDFGKIADSCKSNIQMEFLRTDNKLTEIKSLHSFFPILKAKEFVNTFTNDKKILDKEIFYSEINFSFELFDKDEIVKIPNYDKIKRGFTASIKVFAVPVCNKENKPTFDIYILYSRFKDSFYCEWNTIKKRVVLNSGEKIKLELPARDWRMRAFNPKSSLNIDWYKAYHKYVKEFIIISVN
ncbi:MAG: hypothetical protein ACEPO8_10785 [Rhodothermaceae bacterium]